MSGWTRAQPGALLLWDFDGTLASRPGLWSGCVMEVLEADDPEHGVSLEQIRAGLRGGFPWHRAEEPHPHAVNAELWWEGVEAMIAGALENAGVARPRCATLARATRARFVDPSVGWALFEDTLGALGTLSDAGWRHAIVSNHVPELEHLVRGLGLDAHVERVFSSALIGYEKPNVAIFRHVLAACGEPDRVWMIGDNPVADVAGAEAAGIDAILVRTQSAEVPRRAAGLLDAAQIILDGGLHGAPGPAGRSL